MRKKAAKRVKHISQRTCVGCRQVLEKHNLIRLVRTPQGIFVDPTKKAPGRGAYLHDKRTCWERGLAGALAHALKVELTEEDRVKLSEYLLSLPAETPTQAESIG